VSLFLIVDHQRAFLFASPDGACVVRTRRFARVQSSNL